jgi:hypothetical protein
MVFIVFFDQKLPVFKHEPFDLPYVMRRHAIIACQPYRRKPELAFSIRAADMNMRRLVSLVRVKMKTESANLQDSRHIAFISSFLRSVVFPPPKHLVMALL